MVVGSVSPVSDPAFNPFGAEFTRNPYPSYKRLREIAPVHSVRGCLGTDWVLSRYEDIRRILTDPSCLVDDLPARIRRTARDAAEVQALCDFVERWLFFVNPPSHTHLRETIGPHFSRAAISGLEPTIRRLTEDLLSPKLRVGRIDLVLDVAQLLPCQVAASLLGVPFIDTTQIVEWSVDLFAIFVQPASPAHYRRLNQQTERFRQYLVTHWNQSRSEPGLITSFVSKTNEGTIDVDQALAFCMMLFSVGQETTQHLMGNGMLALLDHPVQMDRVRHGISLVNIKELARFNTPVQMIMRRAGSDMIIRGNTIRAGERLHLLLGSAHHDEDVFQAPEELDLSRTEASGLLFGTGPHVCLGLHVALLTAQIAINAMVEALHNLRPANRERHWIRSSHMRGLASLPCYFDSTPI